VNKYPPKGYLELKQRRQGKRKALRERSTRSATGWALATLLALLCPAQCWGAASPATRATSAVAAVTTAVKPTVSSAARTLSVAVKTPALPATPLSPAAPIVSAKAPSVPAVSVQVTAPAVSVKAGSSGVSVGVTAPAVSVKATAPAVNVSGTVPPVSATVPTVSVKATAPTVSAKASTPAVSVKTPGATSSVVTTSAPGVSVKTSGASRPGGASVVPAVAVELPGASSASNTARPPSGAASRRAVAGSASAGAAHNGPVASASAAVLSDGGSAALDGGLATRFGQQAFGGYANPSAGVVARQRLLEHEARRIVQRLVGCLATLSRRERLLLELLVGVDVPRALTRDEVAQTLHIRSASVPRRERMAIARLLVLARTTACARVAQSAPTMELASYTVLAVPGGVEAASGGVKAARYAKAPSGGSTRASGRSELASIPASHTGTLLLLIATLVAALAIFVLSVDAVGAGPRNRRWRARWLAGQRQAWRRRRRR
jgi:hypothetical protein